MNALTLSPFLLAALALACSGSKSEAQGPGDVACPPGQTFDGQYCQVDQNVASAETPVATTTTSPAVAASDPAAASGGATSQEIVPEDEPPQAKVDEGTETAALDAAGEASPVDITMASQAAPIIQYLAGSHLPSGARQLGAPFAGQFAEGQVLSQKIQVVEGKCYTVVAVAMPPVRELNVLLFQEGSQKPLLEDVLTGTQAVIGSREKCYRAPKSESLQLVLQVEKGNGVAAGQVFQK